MLQDLAPQAAPAAVEAGSPRGPLAPDFGSAGASPQGAVSSAASPSDASARRSEGSAASPAGPAAPGEAVSSELAAAGPRVLRPDSSWRATGSGPATAATPLSPQPTKPTSPKSNPPRPKFPVARVIAQLDAASADSPPRASHRRATTALSNLPAMDEPDAVGLPRLSAPRASSLSILPDMDEPSLVSMPKPASFSNLEALAQSDTEKDIGSKIRRERSRKTSYGMKTFTARKNFASSDGSESSLRLAEETAARHIGPGWQSSFKVWSSGAPTSDPAAGKDHPSWPSGKGRPLLCPGGAGTAYDASRTTSNASLRSEAPSAAPWRLASEAPSAAPSRLASEAPSAPSLASKGPDEPTLPGPAQPALASGLTLGLSPPPTSTRPVSAPQAESSPSPSDDDLDVPDEKMLPTPLKPRTSSHRMTATKIPSSRAFGVPRESHEEELPRDVPTKPAERFLAAADRAPKRHSSLSTLPSLPDGGKTGSSSTSEVSEWSTPVPSGAPAGPAGPSLPRVSSLPLMSPQTPKRTRARGGDSSLPAS